jgi:hypothetical protein
VAFCRFPLDLPYLAITESGCAATACRKVGRRRPLANAALAEALDDYVGPDNPVRFIEAFVDRLALTISGFIRVTPKATGRPP